MTDYSDKIERYFRDLMSPEEESAFLQEMKDNEELRKEAKLTALIIQDLKERQVERDTAIYEDVIKAKRKAKVITLVRRALPIAAMIVIVFGAALWRLHSQSDADALFTEYYSSYTLQGESRGQDRSRGNDSNVEKDLASLFNQVGTAKDISPIIDQLQKIYDSVDSEYEYSLYADDITWYLALAYLKDNQPEKAQELLKTLAEKDTDKAKEAKKLIQAIDK